MATSNIEEICGVMKDTYWSMVICDLHPLHTGGHWDSQNAVGWWDED